MSDSRPTTTHDEALHELLGTLNGLGLQLEVMALAFSRQDPALHERALCAAREAAAELTRRIVALRADHTP